ncbi:MAG: glutamate-5-semialdehyde dehydrogenase [Eggerthellaceae bacterium]|nr:glutamate-5-semialdehyde dehydrogenase [Eggerthellaceae bacterium]
MKIIEQATLAKMASNETRNLSLEQRNGILQRFKELMLEKSGEILKANAKDVEAATHLDPGMIDRLMLNDNRIKQIAEGVDAVIELEDPLEIVLEDRDIPCGIHLQRVSVPLGVVGIIFESRPNVTADCFALCLKSGNACILKGGKESYESCLAIVKQMKVALAEFGVSENTVMLCEKPTHEESRQLMADNEHVDVLIPRGSKRLIQAVVEHSKVPVIETGAGICHAFVDASANQDMALAIIINGKCQRPSVCNALECVLVHKDIAAEFVPKLLETLKANGVNKFFCNKQEHSLCPEIKAVGPEIYDIEYNDLKLNIDIKDSVEAAVDHIENHGTHHSDIIISEDPTIVKYFMKHVNSACVYHNASTRFTDGFMFGLGAEIGISTQKLHSRGPMGLNALTTFCYRLNGTGQIRE